MTADPLRAVLAQGLAALGPDIGPGATLGLAVSGGGDSMALLHLAADWATDMAAGSAGGQGIALAVATVDHRLRPESGAEAQMVARTARALGLTHATLPWDRPGDAPPRGNLQQAARRARRDLLADWARQAGLTAVALAHTRDDAAETLMMELARGAGLDGLAGMAPVFHHRGVRFVRPLLGADRAALRDLLRRRGLSWVEDPSNRDPRFARARVRAALETLDLPAAALAQAAAHLRTAREGRDGLIALWVGAHVRQEAGDLLIDPAALARLPHDPARRLLGRALAWIGGRDHPPRAGALDPLLARCCRGAPGLAATLHGCLIRHTPAGLRLLREPRATEGQIAEPGTPWDGRWQITGPFAPGMELRALGAAGLAQRPGWRGGTRLGRLTLIAGPAVWQGARLIAAPLLEPDGPFQARCTPDFASLWGADQADPGPFG